MRRHGIIPVILSFFLIIILVPHENSNAQTSEVIALDTFYNSDYGVSIKYPQNWSVNDKVIEWKPIPEYDDGGAFIVSFYGNSDFSGQTISLTLIKNDIYARNYQDDEYIEQMIQLQKLACDDNIYCRGYSSDLLSILSIDGHKAYQIRERFTQTHENEKPTQHIGILTNIIYGTNVWSIYSTHPESEHTKVVSTMKEIVESFDLDESVYGLGKGIRFFENELYDFSFEAPTNWRYKENMPNPDGSVTQIMIYPEGFNPLYDTNTPYIIVFFENIPESKVPHMSGQAFEKYHTEIIRSDKFTGAKIISTDSQDKSWGWEISTEFVFSQSFGLTGEQYHTEQRAFHFKDREVYTVGYFATDEYYDTYHPVYDHVLDTLIIKGVVVPEFHEIAMIVLASGIIGIIAISKKSKILNS